MTRSLTEETLIDETTGELLTYLRDGALNTHALARSLDYEGLDIDNWDRLKRIHFCLSTEVQNFVTALPDRIRRIKTENQREHIRTQGEIRGAIDWGSTLRTWSDTGYADRSRFVCNTPYTEYDIAENRILKRLLWQIHRTVMVDLAEVDYDWRREYWTDDHIAAFTRLYKQNVHLNRIGDGQTISITGQDMNTARKSRRSIYTDAYHLYDQYQRLKSDIFDEEVSELLANTVIVPTSTPRLFELFCIFRLVRLLDEDVGGFKLRPIDGKREVLAQLESDDQRIEVYHDRIGNLQFHETLDPNQQPTHTTYKRYQDALLDYSDALTALTGDEHDPIIYSGRPDLLIEVYDTTSPDDRLVSVVIGEIKYSSNHQVFKQGLEELVMYRRFANRDGYLFDDPDISVSCLLITNGVLASGTIEGIGHLNGSELLRPDSGQLLRASLTQFFQRADSSSG